MASKPLRRLIVFHRHGQRAPAKDLSKDSPFVGDLGERDLWLPLMFPRNRFNCVDGYGVDSSVSYEQLQTLFPVVYYGKNGCEGQSVRTQSDRESFPFGCLTQLGAERMLSVGRSLRRNISTESEAEACQVEVWSTNYLRTQVCFIVQIVSASNVAK